jgi:hypothetical protein
VTALKISRTIALLVGVALPIIETWRRWDRMADWPSWLDDYIGAVLLLYAWQAGRHESTRSRPYLLAAWGYTFGMAYMSFFGQLRSATITDPSGMPIAAVIGFKGFGMALAAICLALAWPPREH